MDDSLPGATHRKMNLSSLLELTAGFKAGGSFCVALEQELNPGRRRYLALPEPNSSCWAEQTQHPSRSTKQNSVRQKLSSLGSLVQNLGFQGLPPSTQCLAGISFYRGSNFDLYKP